jgi:integrase
LAHYHPHDLRHRYASVKIAEGVPVTDLAAQLGHSKKSLTLDTYSRPTGRLMPWRCGLGVAWAAPPRALCLQSGS